ECDEAPYGWYNADSLGQMKIKGTGIIDSPEGASKANLRSDKVWWNFMTDGSTAPEANGSGWSEVSTVSKLLKDDLHLTLDASTADATTGVLPMYVSFKDDLGNVSTPTAISSLKYDNDKPVIGTMVWENSSGEEILPLCNDELLNTQTLRIPFTEALSGVKKMKIWLTDGDGNEIDKNPLSNSGMKIYYKATGSSSKTLLSSSDYSVEYDDDEKVATVTFTSDSSNYAKKSGTFYITNLIATEEETTKINVEMMDCATNVSEDKTIEIHCDHVDPEVKEAKFLDTDGVEHAIKVEYYGQAAGTTRYYLAKDTLTALNATSATKIPLKLEVKESGSGIKKIKFAGDIKLSSSTKVYVGTDKTLLSTTDITISTSDQTVVFKDGKNPKLKSEGSGNTCIYFTNLVASNVNAESSNDGNALKIELTDFADNENTGWNEYSCGDDDGLSKIRIDTLSPQLAATTKVVLKDTGYTSTTRSDETKNPVDAESGYTNSNFVDMEVNYPKDEGNGSGVKKLYIKSGATIDSATKIYVQKASATEPTELVSGTDYDIVGTDCVEFAKSFFYSVNDEASTDEYTLILRDLKLSSVSNASYSTVYVYVVDSVGWSSQDWTDYKDKYYASIKYLSIGIGTNAPMLGSTISYAWPFESGASGLVVDASEKNADNNTVYYFFENSNDNSSNSELGIKYSLGGNTYAYRIYKYSGDDAFTKTAAEIVAASNTESTASGTNGYRSLADYASYSYASPATDSTAPSGTKKMWSVVFVDKGGNLSKVQSFCIVKDTQAPSEKMGDGVTAADYFPFKYESIYGSSGEEYNVMCRQDTAT
ncbi:MAG: hypothetical protein II547_03350, partial [Treponema sp.]|nr:hypothetical protein [Treponema sp.]